MKSVYVSKAKHDISMLSVSDTETELMTQIAPTSKSGHAPAPIKSVTPYN